MPGFFFFVFFAIAAVGLKFNAYAQFGAARAGIAVDFLLIRHDSLASEGLDGSCAPAVEVGLHLALEVARAHEVLDEAVFECKR